MKQYLDLLQDVLDNGVERDDRTGTGTISVFGRQTRYDLDKGFPLVTTKKMFTKGIIYELLWFLRGDNHIEYLLKHGVHIWDKDAYRFYCEGCRALKEEPVSLESFLDFAKNRELDENDMVCGAVGRIYGKQWRDWDNSVDQIKDVIDQIRYNPNSRRLIVSAWNPSELGNMALPPCHTLFQFYVVNGKLSCQLYQRSADLFLGVPFNIASYALLTMMIAQVCGLGVGEFIHTIGDAHIYKNHIFQVKEQLSREPLELPTMKINPRVKNIDDFKYEDFELVGYKSYPAIKGEQSF